MVKSECIDGVCFTHILSKGTAVVKTAVLFFRRMVERLVEKFYRATALVQTKPPAILGFWLGKRTAGGSVLFTLARKNHGRKCSYRYFCTNIINHPLRKSQAVSEFFRKGRYRAYRRAFREPFRPLRSLYVRARSPCPEGRRKHTRSL